MSSANERQVGGEHYKRPFQHWDLMAMAKAGYFSGQITKYSERHSKKNGKQDLEKALHFAEKMHEVGAPNTVTPHPQYRRGSFGRKVLVPVEAPVVQENPALLTAIRDYAVEAGLTAIQERIFEYCLLRPERTSDIVELCKKHLEREYSEPREVVYAPASAPVRGPVTIPTVFVGDEFMTSDQLVMKSDLLGVNRPGTPEDGGQHGSLHIEESEELPLLEPELNQQIEGDLSAALEDAIKAQRGELVLPSAEKKK